ncbi:MULTISPECIES: hypothetical protein [Asticcacaulis]|uniref:hypothetical protein n=1 Tax=Asticcacaulis TaxID=76890 RepID=UPI001AE481AE|nr:MULTISPECIES: hypothetical protein [Asticcacaulis]MBP2157477.1 hypothetical protein [Asticcacaulis solisilvae]MDR6798522.1 hypothetical protein [Asticcacaulis sp. BE141]
MTKDGRPSRINDIRLFAGSAANDLKGFEEQVAFGRRLAWWLNGEGVSIGAHTALYVWFADDISVGRVDPTDRWCDWWFRYAKIGVNASFPGIDAGTQIEEGIVAGLKAAAPALAETFDRGARTVKAHGDKLRFLLKERETKRYKMEVSCTLAAGPTNSLLYVSLQDKASGLYYEAPPAEAETIYFDTSYFAGLVKVRDLSASIAAKASPASQPVDVRQVGDLVWSLSDFKEAQRPETSGLINFR